MRRRRRRCRKRLYGHFNGFCLAGSRGSERVAPHAQVKRLKGEIQALGLGFKSHTHTNQSSNQSILHSFNILMSLLIED